MSSLLKYLKNKNFKKYNSLFSTIKPNISLDMYYEHVKFIENIRVVTSYKNRILHGAFYKYNENGQIIEYCNYNNGKIHGQMRYYHKNGKVANTLVVLNNIKHGYFKCYNEDSVLVHKFKFVNNEKHGDEFIYAKHGSVLRINKYHHGKKLTHE